MKTSFSSFITSVIVLSMIIAFTNGCSNDSKSKSSVELEKERLALEREKLELEKQKMELEREKAKERQKATEKIREPQSYETREYEQPQITTTRYFVVMDQIDDVGTIYLNGSQIASCEWRNNTDGSISPIDITSQLRSGRNTIRFNLYNKKWSFFGGKYSYHFKLYKRTDNGGTEVMFERQGSRSDKTAGERFDESYSFYKE